MSNKISEFTKNLRRFATVNKTSVIIIAVELLVMAAAVVWIFGFGPKMGGNQVSNVGTTTGQTTNKGESESTATSEETQAEEPTIYPDETIEFQLPEVDETIRAQMVKDYSTLQKPNLKKRLIIFFLRLFSRLINLLS
jgi:hypothetical protein